MSKSEKSIINTLRDEYYNILPSLEAANTQINLEISCLLKVIICDLKPHQRIRVITRIKECESAINALRRRKESRTFESNGDYSLKTLPDLVGARILYFSNDIRTEIDTKLKNHFKGWAENPIKIKVSENNSIDIMKYYGKFDKYEFNSEYQIVPMLISSFWDIEHALLYKPHPNHKSIKNSVFMKVKYNKVIKSLYEFEAEFNTELEENSSR